MTLARSDYPNLSDGEWEDAVELVMVMGPDRLAVVEPFIAARNNLNGVRSWRWSNPLHEVVA